MDQAEAVTHLKTACIPANPADAALIAEWQTARANLGAPVANAGAPDIQQIPAAHANHVQQLSQLPWVAQALQTTCIGADFRLVEIDPLLAFQFTVNTARANHHCGSLSNPPTMQELLDCCLPLTPPQENYDWQRQPQSIIIKSKSLNLITRGQGLFNDAAGIIFGSTLPLVHVVRFNNACYLHNGFHRAFGARIAGATHVPCMFRDVATAEAVGIRTGAGTFSTALLTSANPPTVGHFSQGRAHNVTLRELTRIIHVSWSEYTLYNE